MPVLIWGIVWLVAGMPDVAMWNVWAVSLAICIAWWILG